MTRSVRGAIHCLCVLLSLQASPAKAQEENAPRASHQDTGQAPVASHPGVSMPAPLEGIIPQLTAYPEATIERTNLLVGSIGVNALYMDNAFISKSKPVGDYQYSVIPSIGWQSFSPRTQWLLNYGGGLTYDQRISGNSQQTQGGAADLRFKFTQRLVSEFRQGYAITNNPFTRIDANQSLFTLTGQGELSPFAVASNATRTDSVSAANLIYQFSRHSVAGISGSFSAQEFRDAVAPSGASGSLIDTQNVAGRAFYVRRLSARHAMGTEYRLQDLKFASGLARTVGQTLFLFDGISLRTNMTLSLFAGPQFTHTHNALVLSPNFKNIVVPVLSDEWSVSGGFAYTWQGRRTGFRLSGERGVSDGGGFIGAVRLNTAALELQKAMGAHWSATLQLIYSDGRSVGLPAKVAASRVTTEEALIGLVRRLTPNISATARYGRIQQPHAGTFTQDIQTSHNQAEVGLTYQFQRPLPR